jgi:hypothetical protein
MDPEEKWEYSTNTCNGSRIADFPDACSRDKDQGSSTALDPKRRTGTARNQDPSQYQVSPKGKWPYVRLGGVLAAASVLTRVLDK